MLIGCWEFETVEHCACRVFDRLEIAVEYSQARLKRLEAARGAISALAAAHFQDDKGL